MQRRCDICGKMCQTNSTFEWGVLEETQYFCSDCGMKVLEFIDKSREAKDGT